MKTYVDEKKEKLVEFFYFLMGGGGLGGVFLCEKREFGLV